MGKQLSTPTLPCSRRPTQSPASTRVRATAGAPSDIVGRDSHKAWDGLWVLPEGRPALRCWHSTRDVTGDPAGRSDMPVWDPAVPLLTRPSQTGTEDRAWGLVLKIQNLFLEVHCGPSLPGAEDHGGDMDGTEKQLAQMLSLCSLPRRHGECRGRSQPTAQA